MPRTAGGALGETGCEALALAGGVPWGDEVGAGADALGAAGAVSLGGALSAGGASSGGTTEGSSVADVLVVSWALATGGRLTATVRPTITPIVPRMNIRQ